MLTTRLDVLRQLQTTTDKDETRDFPLAIGSPHGVIEVHFVALRESDNALVVRRSDGRLAFIPLDFVRSSWREARPAGTFHRVRVTTVGWRRLVRPPLQSHGSKRSRFTTFVHAATKSRTSFSCASELP